MIRIRYPKVNVQRQFIRKTCSYYKLIELVSTYKTTYIELNSYIRLSQKSFITEVHDFG